MPFPLPPHDPHDPRAVARARQRFMLQLTVALLVLSAIVVLFLPLGLPKPVRLAVVGTDLIAAAIIWLLGRQRYGR